MQVNVKNIKVCAFCKYWYDPANSHIKPKAPNVNLWEYDNRAKAKCLTKNFDTPSFAACPRYECKVPVL
ncbi:MAG: hypothetical protein ACI4TH_05310 [Candidatus Ornithomonoglobus sp.]